MFVAAAVVLLAVAAITARVASRRVGRRYETALAVARHEAEHDGLTGALTRAAFARELTQRIADATRERELTLLAIDVDGFGHVNKQRGHEIGDRLLVHLARTLARVVRHEDVVGRLGGDEFAVLVGGDDPLMIAERILAALRDGDGIDVSVGLASAPSDGADAPGLLRAADVAMRRAKRAGKGCVVVYRGESLADHGDAQARRALATLIEQRAVRMVVQPIVSLASGRIHAYEALARFSLPGQPTTAEAFAIADRVGLREELDLTCLRAGLTLLRVRPHGTRLSLNISAPLLSDARVLALLDAEPDLHGLVLEVTEDALVRSYGELRRVARPLLERGVQLAVDDMGAGYAGLRHAIDLHPRYLKLDRSLVQGIDRDPKRAALVAALLRYAEHAGSHIVVEGVETEAELRTLTRLGVPFAQGYLLARPAQPWPQLAIDLAPAAADAAFAWGGAASPALAGGPHDVGELTAAATTEEVHARFAADAALDALVVLDEHRRVLGLLTRHRLLARLGHRFGFALYGQRSVLGVADRQCLALPLGTPWPELSARAMARPADTRHDPILLLDEGGRLVRHLTIRQLLATAAGDYSDAASVSGVTPESSALKKSSAIGAAISPPATPSSTSTATATSSR